MVRSVAVFEWVAMRCRRISMALELSLSIFRYKLFCTLISVDEALSIFEVIAPDLLEIQNNVRPELQLGNTLEPLNRKYCTC